MGIDNTTPVSSFWCIFPNDKEFLEILEENAENEALNECSQEEECSKLLISDSLGNIRTEEYYFDKEEGGIRYTGNIELSNGKTVFISFLVPLSDTVQIDIVENSVKKLNKFKSALESVK